MSKWCVLMKYFTFFFKQWLLLISNWFEACFGPFWTELAQKKKKFGHRCSCSRIHGHTTHSCVSDSGAPAQSFYFLLLFFLLYKNLPFYFLFLYLSLFPSFSNILASSSFPSEHHPFTNKYPRFSLKNNKIFTNKSQTCWWPLSILLKNNITSLRPTYQFLPIKFFSQPRYQSSLGSMILNIMPQTH